jgi:hypothetical protein
MKPKEIVNEELQGILLGLSDIIETIDISKIRQIPRDETADEWCGEEFRKHIINKGTSHDGFPDMLLGTNLEYGKFCYDGENRVDIVQRMESHVTDLCTWSGAHRRALTAVYPPGGFISWHNNANAPGYNVLFTWSQEGDGQWEHVDPDTREHIVIPDKKGWQCKFGYYGTYQEPESLLYHCARTNCLRATVAFVFNADDRGKSMAEMLLEEIQNA